MHQSFIALALAAAASLSSATRATEAPSRVEIDNFEAVSVKHVTITAIDPKTREVTTKHEMGQEGTFHAGPEVRNFDQLRVGDVVTLKRTHSVAIELKKVAGGSPQRTESFESERAPAGVRPGVATQRIIHLVGNISFLDKERGEVAVQGAYQTRHVRVDDKAALGPLKMGDQVEAKVIESEVLSIQPAKMQ